MQEIELKFLVPEARLKGLMRQVQVKSSQTTQLAAHYYDTSDQQLAQAGIGLRIRKEGDTWVQTIKAGGDGMASRLEHNAILDNEQVQAMLDTDSLMPDLTIYKDTPIAPALSNFKLKKLAQKLTPLYVTDVQRTTRLLIEDSSDQVNNQTDNQTNNQASNSIEMAYDHGEIIHGTDDTQREVIQEIEFELVSGDLDFLFMTAKTWCKRYKLCLSTVTKAERGGLLINGQPHSPAVYADLEQLNIDKDISMPAFVRAAVHNCLLQILPNSSAVVAGSTDNEHISQLHTGIHRLHTVLKAFAHFSDEINPDWQPILKQTDYQLNDYLDLTHLANHIDPKLQRFGAPVTDWKTDIESLKIQPSGAVSANDFQITLLELIAFTMSDSSIDPQADKLAIEPIIKVLSQQHDSLLNADKEIGDASYSIELDSDDIDSDDIDSGNKQHVHAENNDEGQSTYELRNQLTELRYITEIASPLLHKKSFKKKTKRSLKHLIKEQKALDEYHDDIRYQQHYQLKSATDSNALYGAGWFAVKLSIQA